MALGAMGVAVFLELRGQSGLTPTMSAFLLGVVGMFSVANFANTSRHMASKQPQPAPSLDGLTVSLGDLPDKINEIHQMTANGAGNPESLNTLVSVLGSIKTDMEKVKSTTGEIGKSVAYIVGKR